MPIYEYECTGCHQITEIWQSLSDAPATTCPSCSGDLKKIISMSSF
ncbi:MAG: zinc ribbon domain-containing protein, partial [Desulfobulbaceae bacterium]|nr:zinc ribbon domain-containing protein [Desulfobulbaceae bacterium]